MSFGIGGKAKGVAALAVAHDLHYLYRKKTNEQNQAQ